MFWRRHFGESTPFHLTSVALQASGGIKMLPFGVIAKGPKIKRVATPTLTAGSPSSQPGPSPITGGSDESTYTQPAVQQQTQSSDTEEHGSKWARTRRSTNPFSPLESEHNLFFKLADMPGNEQLLAASIRLRYVPTEDWNRTTVNTQCRDTAHHEKWPVTVWLHYNSPVKSDTYETKTIGSFEPDTEYCGQTSDESNGKLIHFPAGWFNIPLNEVILAMLREVSSRNNGSNGDRTNNDGRVISMRVRSLVSDLHFPTHTEQVLRLKKPDSTGEKQYLDTQWLHEAPHLFTFHRDPALVEHVRRTRRSVPLSLETPVESSTIKSTTESLRTKVQDGGTFMKRYKKLQQLLQSKLQNTDRKRRPRRRAYYQRRQSRSSHDQWRSSANTYQYRQHSSANGYRDQRAYNSKRYTKEESRGTGMSKTAEQYGYDSSDALSVDMNSPNYLDSLCQRRELIIDFAAVGWAGWVIAPTSYNARYCQGQCPFPLSTHYNTTNHAVLLQLVHLLDAARIPGPCCVPNQLSPQSLLYHTQSGDVVLRVYQDMVVESCACR
ncbi:hypothetical protein T265_11186 [Opisthorchis viverrini]|uniref:TGF-beta family profile domain-containing protein n=1 Tax=Opisthorchis viverrini TaxID=6198 RepID=A0A074ZYJ2_OPIVI|nr:hypothetical protein T265_11186 [Opisthorchis viverrini]KER20219.1 hypothetical protein T265_11186 [Opisthorchis viverrini]